MCCYWRPCGPYTMLLGFDGEAVDPLGLLDDGTVRGKVEWCPPDISVTGYIRPAATVAPPASRPTRRIGSA
ncbi:hypothetical protein Sdia_60720 [Streptomyces diastaticus subsp. diastaticus]|uniref:Uncharacterized protein n=1 Tax=Streptomyces diastaticus subsp. diastaticus TaxID=68040 RepID=A0ABQ1CYC2_STRDI|nr:hypothetical protein Sdia_60720 [Streptomyces diastaticus subsp. diastaticus]GGU42992.1 hypothetical protein GCM10015534_51840 [Streptomyces diastaticus subsp. diastaticus]